MPPVGADVLGRLFDFPFVRGDKSNRSRSSCGNATCGIDPDSGTAPPLIPCDSRSTYQSENFHCPPPSTFSTSFRDHPPSCCKCGVLKHFTVIFEKLGVANRTEAVVKLWGTSLERTWPPGMSTAKVLQVDVIDAISVGPDRLRDVTAAAEFPTDVQAEADTAAARICFFIFFSFPGTVGARPCGIHIGRIIFS